MIAPRVWGYMFLLVCIWSFSATVEAITLRGLTPVQFTAWSTFFGATGMLAYLVMTGQGASILKYRAVDHLHLLALSILGFSGYFLLKYYAYITISVALGNILQYTYPVFIVLFAMPVLKQPVTRSKIVGVVTGFFGAAVIFSGGRLLNLDWANFPGYLAALLAGCSWGLFSVLAARAAFNPVSSLFFMHLYSSLLTFGILFAGGTFGFPGGPKEIAGAMYSGIVSNVFGVLLWLAAQRSTDDVSTLTGLLYAVPFLSLAALKLFLGVPISGYAYIGLILIIGGVALHTLHNRSGKGKATVS